MKTPGSHLWVYSGRYRNSTQHPIATQAEEILDTEIEQVLSDAIEVQLEELEKDLKKELHNKKIGDAREQEEQEKQEEDIVEK